jgi:hypothetical protein
MQFRYVTGAASADSPDVRTRQMQMSLRSTFVDRDRKKPAM